MKRMVTKTDIVETVNKAIEDGDISVSSETPLYKHSIGGGTVTGNATFISERETAYTTINEIWKDYIKGKIKFVRYSGPSSVWTGFFFSNSAGNPEATINSLQVVGFSGDGTTINRADITSFSTDIVSVVI